MHCGAVGSGLLLPLGSITGIDTLDVHASAPLGVPACGLHPTCANLHVLQGIQDMLLQYLQLVMGFNTADQAVLITVLGAGNVVVQVSSHVAR